MSQQIEFHLNTICLIDSTMDDKVILIASPCLRASVVKHSLESGLVNAVTVLTVSVLSAVCGLLSDRVLFASLYWTCRPR